MLVINENPNGRNVEVRFKDGSSEIFSPGPEKYSWVQFAIANEGLPKWLVIDNYNGRHLVNTDNIEYMAELPV